MRHYQCPMSGPHRRERMMQKSFMFLEGENDPEGMYSGDGDLDLQLQNESEA